MSNKPHILIVSELTQPMLDALAQHFTLHKGWLADQPQLLRDYATQIRGAFTRGNQGISGELIDSLPSLEVISSFGVGVDAIDLPKARARGILVSNTPRVLDECVADTGLALMLAVTRTICTADRFARSGEWLKRGYPMAWKMTGKRCGIVGMGNIGREVAQRVAGFKMPIHYFSPRDAQEPQWQRHNSIEELAAAVDFLVLTLPGGAATRHIINAEVLKALGPEGILINIARGSVVDTDALIGALHSGQIRGAGLDVFEQEPQIPPALCEMDNVVLLPHLASNTAETRQAMADLAIDNLLRYFRDGSVNTPV